MGKRKRFNQSAILRYLKARCERCHKGIPDVDLTTHHRNHNAGDDRWQNIVIYCRACHSIVEGTDKRKSHLR